MFEAVSSTIFLFFVPRREMALAKGRSFARGRSGKACQPEAGEKREHVSIIQSGLPTSVHPPPFSRGLLHQRGRLYRLPPPPVFSYF